MDKNKYKMVVVRGSFVDIAVLDAFNPVCIEKYENDNWLGLDELVITLDEIKMLQKSMIHHYDNPKIPWYMDGHKVEDTNQMIVAFGADDGEGGRIFQFKREDELEVGKVVEYGVSKGIPKEQMDFGGINL